MDRPIDPRLQADVLAPGADEVQLHQRQAELVAAARGQLRAVASAVLGERLASFDEAQTRDKREFFVVTDVHGRSANIFVDAIPLASGTIATTATNTTTDQYIVQISDRLPQEHLARVLAHEVGELIAVRDRSSQGLAPVRENLLERGSEIGERPELSSQDHGRIGELNWLAGRALDARIPEQQRTEARSDLSAYLDRCGLRPITPVSNLGAYASEQRAARARQFTSWNSLSPHAKRMVDELAHPIEQLAPTDAAALQASREAALVAQRQVEAFIGRREVTMPMPGYDQNGVPLPREQLETAAQQWAEYRAQVSDRTVQALENQNAAQQFPPRQVVIGGGASLTGLDPDALLVDGVGRWHLDPGDGIVQSADQDRDLAQWMGVDPYQAVEEPGDRISIDAVRLWEDQLATQGDVVNGRASLRISESGDLWAEVRPFDRDRNERDGAPLWVAVDGTPRIATGLTPEVVPGIVRDTDGKPGVESRSEAVRLISERLHKLEEQGVAGVHELRERLTAGERNGSGAATVLHELNSPQIREALFEGLAEGAPTARMHSCFTALEATEKWEAAREAAPGRALMGDEVAENRFNAGDAEFWIVAGSGGTGVANAEIILTSNLDAKVTIIGGRPPGALMHQVQYPQMRKDFEDRLTFIEADVGAIETVRDGNGQASFRLPYVLRGTNESGALEGEGFVSSLGRTNPLPPAVQELADNVRDNGGAVSGDLMFDKDDQYIGYGLTFRTENGREHRVDVDGAASWQLPREVFPPELGLQGELNQMGARALPAETGNAAPGFSPIARQSALRARAVAAEQAGDPNAVRRRPDVPDRWKRPGPETAAESAAMPTPSPGSAPTLAPTLTPTAPQREAAPEIPKQPAPAPAPQEPRPGHQWQVGIPQTRRPSRPTPTQPQQAPPDHQRPGPNRGPGLGD